MGLGATRGGSAAARGEQNDRLARRGSRLREGTAVAEVLGVHGDRRGGLVPGAVLDQVDEGDIGLVAERDEPGEAEAVPLHAELEFEGQISALAQQRDTAGREGVRGEMQLGRVVGDAQTVGADQDRTCLPHPCGECLLPGQPVRTGLGETGGDADDGACAALQSLVDRGLEARPGHGDHHELDGLADRGEAGCCPAPENGPTAAVDQVHRPASEGAQRLRRHGVTVFRRVVAGPDHGHGLGIEERSQVTSHVTSPAAARSWGSSRRRRGPRLLPRAVRRRRAPTRSPIRRVRSDRGVLMAEPVALAACGVQEEFHAVPFSEGTASVAEAASATCGTATTSR